MIKVIITREEAHRLRAEIDGHPEAGIHRGKKAVVALGNLAEHNKSLFNIHKEGEKDTRLQIVTRENRGIFFTFLAGRADIRPAHGDSPQMALGELIHDHRELFQVEDIKHVGK